jgi:hypothetical protein
MVERRSKSRTKRFRHRQRIRQTSVGQFLCYPATTNTPSIKRHISCLIAKRLWRHGTRKRKPADRGTSQTALHAATYSLDTTGETIFIPVPPSIATSLRQMSLSVAVRTHLLRCATFLQSRPDHDIEVSSCQISALLFKTALTNAFHRAREPKFDNQTKEGVYISLLRLTIMPHYPTRSLRDLCYLNPLRTRRTRSTPKLLPVLVSIISDPSAFCSKVDGRAGHKDNPHSKRSSLYDSYAYKANTVNMQVVTGAREHNFVTSGMLVGTDGRASHRENLQSEIITKDLERTKTAHITPTEDNAIIPHDLEPEKEFALQQAAFDELLVVLQASNPQPTTLTSFGHMVCKLYTPGMHAKMKVVLGGATLQKGYEAIRLWMRIQSKLEDFRKMTSYLGKAGEDWQAHKQKLKSRSWKESLMPALAADRQLGLFVK